MTANAELRGARMKRREYDGSQREGVKKALENAQPVSASRSNDLLCCPFCGGDAVLHTDGITAITCRNCCCTVTNNERSIAKLMGQWNNRPRTARTNHAQKGITEDYIESCCDELLGDMKNVLNNEGAYQEEMYDRATCTINHISTLLDSMITDE